MNSLDIFTIDPETRSTYTSFTAFNFFISNLKSSQILTDSSRYCITIVLELKDEVDSPYLFYKINTDTNELDIQNVNKILLKITFRKSNATIVHVPGTKEVSVDDDLLREVSTQLDVYKKSFFDEFNFLEPICPAIYSYCKELNEIQKDILKENILNTLKSRREININMEKEIVVDVFSKNISILTMMYLDCKNLSHYTSKSHFRIYINYAIFELLKLYLLGYTHGDFHRSNVVITKDNYLNIEQGSNLPPGRAYIIDFGRTYKHNIINFERMTLPEKIYTIINIENMYIKREYINTFSSDTVDYILSLIKIRLNTFKNLSKRINLESADFTKFFTDLHSTILPQNSSILQNGTLESKATRARKLNQSALNIKGSELDIIAKALAPELDKIAEILGYPKRARHSAEHNKFQAEKLARFINETKEREAEAKKREAEEREAKEKREAEEREAEAKKREAEEREAKEKREAEEREAKEKREAVRPAAFLQPTNPPQSTIRQMLSRVFTPKITPKIHQKGGRVFMTDYPILQTQMIKPSFKSTNVESTNVKSTNVESTDDKSTNVKSTESTDDESIQMSPMKTIRSVKITPEIINSLLSYVKKLDPSQFDLNSEGKGGMKKYKRIVNKLKTKKKRKCLNKTKKNKILTVK